MLTLPAQVPHHSTTITPTPTQTLLHISIGILVCSSYKIPETGWLLKHRNLFLTFLEAGSPK